MLASIWLCFSCPRLSFNGFIIDLTLHCTLSRSLFYFMMDIAFIKEVIWLCMTGDLLKSTVAWKFYSFHQNRCFLYRQTSVECSLSLNQLIFLHIVVLVMSVHWLFSDQWICVCLYGWTLIDCSERVWFDSSAVVLWESVRPRETAELKHTVLLFLAEESFRMKLVHLVKIKQVFHRLRFNLRRHKHVR